MELAVTSTALPDMNVVYPETRRRILVAMAEVCRERALEAASVREIAARAGASEPVLDKLFNNPRDCLLSACEDVVVRAAAKAAPAYETPPTNPWAQPPPGEIIRDARAVARATNLRERKSAEAIAAEPGLSNRGVAEAAGITDEGQISKLLARLHKHGLIDKRHEAKHAGETNASLAAPRPAPLGCCLPPKLGWSAQ